VTDKEFLLYCTLHIQSGDPEFRGDVLRKLYVLAGKEPPRGLAVPRFLAERYLLPDDLILDLVGRAQERLR
jgi:hypothetical protein